MQVQTSQNLCKIVVELARGIAWCLQNSCTSAYTCGTARRMPGIQTPYQPFAQVLKRRNPCIAGLKSWLMLCFVWLLWVSATAVRANDIEADFPVRIENIRMDGLQRVSAGAAFNALDLQTNTEISRARLQDAVKRLFASGYFDDIRVFHDNGVLIFRVVERPTISSITFSGNTLIEETVLQESFHASRITEGEIFLRSTLEQIVTELRRLYALRGRYGTEIAVEQEAQPDNRVALRIAIREAPVSQVLSINFIGNQDFSDARLKSLMQTKDLNNFTTITGANRYAQQTLQSDVAKIRSFYLNRGYAKAQVDSPRVAITSDQRFLYITIPIEEGAIYRIADYRFSGQQILSTDAINAAVTLQTGDLFTQQAVDESVRNLEEALGDLGYGFARVRPRFIFADGQPQNQVSIDFVMEPGQRVYVRRILLRGNIRTTDEALRREMVQMEAAWYEGAKVRQSLRRLRRLKYLQNVEVRNVVVTGVPNQMDLLFTVTEGNFGAISGGLTYSDLSGTSLNLQYSAYSAFGSGNDWSLDFNLNDTDKRISNTLYEPFFTLNNVSRRTSVFYNETEIDEEDISNYRYNSRGLAHSYGYPIGVNSRLEAGLQLTYYDLFIEENATLDITRYTDTYGFDYRDLLATLKLTRNTLNSGLMPTAGTLNSLDFAFSLDTPANPYHRTIYRNESYFPLSEKIREFALRFETRLGYLATFSSHEYPPFYRHFFLGNIGGVRGYSSLGPGATDEDGEESSRNWGGNIQLVERFDFILPLLINQPSVRTSLFYDIGNAFHNRCIVDSEWCDYPISWDSLRRSWGFSLQWFTPIGPLGFIVSNPINAQPGDSTKRFDFFIGQVVF